MAAVRLTCDVGAAQWYHQEHTSDVALIMLHGLRRSCTERHARLPTGACCCGRARVLTSMPASAAAPVRLGRTQLHEGVALCMHHTVSKSRVPLLVVSQCTMSSQHSTRRRWRHSNVQM